MICQNLLPSVPMREGKDQSLLTIEKKRFVIMVVTVEMRGSSLASHPPSWKCCSSPHHKQKPTIVNKSSWMVPQKNRCLTMRRICQNMMRTHQSRMTVLCLSLQQKRNHHKSQRDLRVILCETTVPQIFFAMTILKTQATILLRVSLWSRVVSRQNLGSSVTATN